MSPVAHHTITGAYSAFNSMKQLVVFLTPPPLPLWDASPLQDYPSGSTNFYTWVERGTVKVKCP